MQRIASNLGLAAFAGFSLVAAATPEGGLAPGETMLASTSLPHAALLAAAAILMAALAFANQQAPERRRLGERFGLAGLGLIGATAALSALYGSDIVPISGSFWALLALAAGTVFFDRLVEPHEEDPDFEAGLSAIVQAMAYQPPADTPRRRAGPKGLVR